MLTIAKLVFKSYMPLKLEKGMYFLTKDDVLSELTNLPFDHDLYMRENGAPVEPSLIIEGNPHIKNDTYTIADDDRIGWWDEGDHTDDLEMMTIDHFNFILEECDGYVLIEGDFIDIDDDESHMSYERFYPEIYEGKVIIHPYIPEEYEEYDQDYNEDDYRHEEED